VGDASIVEGYESRTIGTDFAKRCLIGALRDIRTLVDANRRLAADIRSLEQKAQGLVATVQTITNGGESSSTTEDIARRSTTTLPSIARPAPARRSSGGELEDRQHIDFHRPSISPSRSGTKWQGLALVPGATPRSGRRWFRQLGAASFDAPMSAECPFNSEPFNGIFAYITARVNGNIARLGIIKISGNSIDEARDLELPGLVDFTWLKCWTSKNEIHSHIEFDFLEQEVLLTHYTLKTYSSPKGFSHLKSWQLTGKSPNGTWAAIDSREDNDDLNGRWHYSTYLCGSPLQVNAVRLTQTGPNHHGDHYMQLTNVEFFGTIC
jgi:hypothetical protein